jgi:hypothetical protein
MTGQFAVLLSTAGLNTGEDARSPTASEACYPIRRQAGFAVATQMSSVGSISSIGQKGPEGFPRSFPTKTENC